MRKPNDHALAVTTQDTRRQTRMAGVRHGALSLLLTLFFVSAMFGSLRAILNSSTWVGLGLLAASAIGYFALELSESKHRSAGFGEFEVDSSTWWTRPVCWSMAAAYGFCLLANPT